MIFSGVDWAILWKLHHILFFRIYFAVGIAVKALLVWRVGVGSGQRTNWFAILASFVSSAFNTWFQILPLFCAFILINFAGHAADHGSPSSFARLGIVSRSYEKNGERASCVGTRRELNARFDRSRPRLGLGGSSHNDDRWREFCATLMFKQYPIRVIW